jgi:hypothetical protein
MGEGGTRRGPTHLHDLGAPHELDPVARAELPQVLLLPPAAPSAAAAAAGFAGLLAEGEVVALVLVLCAIQHVRAGHSGGNRNEYRRGGTAAGEKLHAAKRRGWCERARERESGLARYLGEGLQRYWIDRG